jgi:UDP-N-acetylmuramate dehydrogenase
MTVFENHSLKMLNTFGLDAKAQFYVDIHTIDELKNILLTHAYRNIPKLILGGGSNLLFIKDFEGLVIKNSIKGIEKMREDAESVWIKVGAGENWHEFVMHCLRNGWYGIENLSLIYGTVGAAPMQNIGAYGVELSEVFDLLIAVEMESGNQQFFTNADCKFGYRDSVFKNELKGKYVIAEVIFHLSKKPKLNISYGAIQQVLSEMRVNQPTPQAVSEAVIRIRKSKLPNPEQIGNAGSFFKNPEIPKPLFENLKEQYPNMPSYPADDQKIKVPAGWLIEQCGWKGKRIGNTGVHKDQALVLVNYGEATGEEIKALAEKIQASVFEKFEIMLETEVNMI